MVGTRRARRVALTLALASALAAGCTQVPTLDELTGPSCDGSDWRAAEHLVLEGDPDFVAVVASEPTDAFSIRSESGPRCAGAADPAGCEARIESALASVRYEDVALVLRYGEGVRIVTDPEEITALMVPIDSIDEAMILPLTLGVYDPPSCTEWNVAGAREAEGGYEVVLFGGVTCADRLFSDGERDVTDVHYLLFVAEDGTIERRASAGRDTHICHDHCDECWERPAP